MCLYLCADFLQYSFTYAYDVIYSSLTMMHFEDKQKVIEKVESLLKGGGIFCLSIYLLIKIKVNILIWETGDSGFILIR